MAQVDMSKEFIAEPKISLATADLPAAPSCCVGVGDCLCHISRETSTLHKFVCIFNLCMYSKITFAHLLSFIDAEYTYS